MGDNILLSMPAMSTPGPTRRTVVAHMARALRVGPTAMAHLTPAEWSAVPAQAEAHGLAEPARAWLLQAPEPVRRELEDYVRRTDARETVLRRDLDALRVAFAARRLDVRWLKAAALWSLDLPRPQPRPAADLDVLASEADQLEAAAVLRVLGYRQSDVSWKHSRWIRPGNTAVVEPRGEHPDNPRPVEVHPRVREAFRGVSVNLTQSTGTGELRGTLLHLAVHATADALQRKLRLLGLLDLKCLAEAADESDWRWLDAWANGTRTARWLWPSLALAAKWVGAPIPETTLARLASRVKLPLRLWSAGVDPDWLSVAGRADRPRPATQVLEIWPVSWREALTVVRFVVAPSPPELADRYPRRTARGEWARMYVRHGRDLVQQVKVIAGRRDSAGSGPGRS